MVDVMGAVVLPVAVAGRGVEVLWRRAGWMSSGSDGKTNVRNAGWSDSGGVGVGVRGLRVGCVVSNISDGD